MKKLSDYKGDEAIELWGNLIIPITNIMSSGGVADIIKKNKGKNITSILGEVISFHKKEIVNILMIIDDTPINGLNLIPRFLNLVSELFADPDICNFFGISEEEVMQVQSIGSAMESTTDEEA